MDASVDGGLLLELYSREGAPNAAMISSDFYQARIPPHSAPATLLPFNRCDSVTVRIIHLSRASHER